MCPEHAEQLPNSTDNSLAHETGFMYCMPDNLLTVPRKPQRKSPRAWMGVARWVLMTTDVACPGLFVWYVGRTELWRMNE